MPCNIGYKTIAPIKIPEPEPQQFSAKAKAPDIDADLLEKLGITDPEFLDWISELKTRPLLEEALRRTLTKIKTGGVTFTVNDEGMLEAEGEFSTPAEKRALAEITDRVTARWQFETLGIVADLLDYDFTINEKSGKLILEAEERGKSHPCDYIKVTKEGDDATITFEHFKTRDALEVEAAKFASLADRLGVKIDLELDEVIEGDPFPGAIHSHENHVHSHDGHSHSH